MRHVLFRLMLLLCGLALALTPRIARAQGKKDGKSIAILVEGDDTKKHRDMIVAVVPEGLEVVGDSEFKGAVRRAGLPGQMGFALTSPGQRPGLLRILRRAVKSSGVEGVVVARVKKAIAGRRDMVLLFVDSSDDLQVDEKLTLKGPDEDDRKAIEAILLPVLEKLVPAAPEPEPEVTPKPKPGEGEGDTGAEEEEEEEAEPEKDGESKFEPNTPGAELFSLALGAEFAGRFFDYSQSDFNSRNTRPYSVCCAPGIVVGAEVYPAATTGIPVLRDVGLTFSYMHAFGVSSQTEPPEGAPDDQRFSFDTFWNRLTAGLRVRFRMVDDPKRPWIIAVSGNFGFQNFEFEAADDPSATILDEIGTVHYLTVRPALDARLPVVDFFALMPSFGFIVPLGSGDTCDRSTPEGAEACNGNFYNRFRDANVYGIDFGLAFAFVLPFGFETRAGIEYTRYFSSFDPVPGDEYVAGGALDQFLAMRVGIAYLY